MVEENFFQLIVIKKTKIDFKIHELIKKRGGVQLYNHETFWCIF